MTTVRDDTARERMTASAPKSPPVWRRPGASIGTLGRVLTLLAAAALTLFLLGTFLLAAARTQGSLSSSGLLSSLSIDNLRYDWQQVHGFGGGVFTTWYVNSIIVCAGGAALSLAVGVPAGYALAKIEFPFRKAILIATLLMMVIPNTVLVIPLFLEVSALHQIGQLWPVTVIFGFFPFGTYLAFIHFDTALPKVKPRRSSSPATWTGSRSPVSSSGSRYPYRSKRSRSQVSSRSLPTGRITSSPLAPAPGRQSCDAHGRTTGTHLAASSTTPPAQLARRCSSTCRN